MTKRLRPMRERKLAILLNALVGVELSHAERRMVEWLASWDYQTVTNVAAVVARVRRLREGTPAGSHASQTSLRGTDEMRDRAVTDQPPGFQCPGLWYGHVLAGGTAGCHR